jgi:hypothetical protein
MERLPKRSKLDPNQMNSPIEVQTVRVLFPSTLTNLPNPTIHKILSIQELDDTLFERFRNLPTSTTSLIDFVEDAFEELRRNLFTIEELGDVEVPEDTKQPFVHFMEDPDYCKYSPIFLNFDMHVYS